MARKKETQEQVEQVKNPVEVTVTEQTAETPEAPLPEIKMDEENKEGNKKPVEAQKAKVEIPAYVDSLLKAYSGYKELYVDKLGGAFTADTQPSLVKDAILYQNPYYNK